MSKVRLYTVSCRPLKICIIVWTLLKTFCLGDMRHLPAMMIGDSALSQQKTHLMVLDTITNGLVYEPLARSDDHLN